jgi:hypothetical protein
MRDGNVIYLGGPPPRPEPPTVEVIRVRDPRGDLLVLPRCPHCGERHVHGAGSKADCGDHGHRVSHCTSGPWHNVGYRLVERCPPATAAARSKTARPLRAKRELRDYRRESDPRVRATLVRRLLHRHGLTHEQIDVVLAALREQSERHPT